MSIINQDEFIEDCKEIIQGNLSLDEETFQSFVPYGKLLSICDGALEKMWDAQSEFLEEISEKLRHKAEQELYNCPKCEEGVLVEHDEAIDSGVCTFCGELSYWSEALPLNKNNPWIIIDWANNHIYPDKEFTYFEDAWDWIYENVKEETEDDGTYDDLYVVEKYKWIPNHRTTPIFKKEG